MSKFTQNLAPAPTQAFQAAQQVAHAAVQQRGAEAIEVRLDPPSLGRVQIGFDFGGDAPRAVVAASQPETLDLLRRNAPMLMQELAEAGLGEFELSWSDEAAAEEPWPADQAFAFATDAASEAPRDATAPLPLRHDGGLDLTL